MRFFAVLLGPKKGGGARREGLAGRRFGDDGDCWLDQRGYWMDLRRSGGSEDIGFPKGLFEGKAGGEGEGVGDEIDLWDDVELWFPVEGEVEGGILEFVVQAYDAGGA